jgi:hypothetical protein
LKLVAQRDLSLELFVGAKKLGRSRCHEMGQFVVGALQDIPGVPQLGDVDAGPDEPLELALGLDSRHAVIEYPAVLSIGPVQPIFQSERLTGTRGHPSGFHALGAIIRVDTFEPTVMLLMFHSSTAKPEPRVVEEGAPTGGIRHPDHDGRRVSQNSEASVTFTKLALDANEVGNVLCVAEHDRWMARLLVASISVQPHLLRPVLPDETHEPAVRPCTVDPVEVGIELSLDGRREESSEIPPDAVLWSKSQSVGSRWIHEQKVAIEVMNTHVPQAALDETVEQAGQPIGWRGFRHQRQGTPVRGEVVTRV